MLAVQGKAEFFSTLDLKCGYWQIAIDENDKKKTACTHHRGLYEYNDMPSGLAYASGIFHFKNQCQLSYRILITLQWLI